MFRKNLPAFFHHHAIFPPKRSLLTLNDIKGSLSAFIHSEDRKHFSPLKGAVLSKLKFHKILYEIANIDSHNQKPTAISQLIHTLYYRINETETLHPTHNKSLAAYALTPTLIATILYYLKINTFNEKPIQKSIIKLLKEEYLSLTGDNLFDKAAHRFINLIHQSKLECANALYPKHLTECILLEFLYQKASTRNDIEQFLKTLHAFNVEIDFTIFNQDKNFNEISLKYHLDTINSQQNYFDSCKKFLDIHEENFFLWALTDHKQLHEVIGDYYPYQGGRAKANCVEASFHNLCNILLFNQNTGLFDFSLLPDTLKPHPEFIQFYKIQPDTNDINKPHIGQAFMNLVSDQPGLIYSSENYELTSDSNNFIPLMNFLFGSHAATLEELSEQFSSEKRKIEFKQDYDFHTMYEINIYENNKILYSSGLNFDFQHCSFMSSILTNTKNKEKNLGKSFEKFKKYALHSLTEDPLLYILISSNNLFTVKELFKFAFKEHPTFNQTAIQEALNYIFLCIDYTTISCKEGYDIACILLRNIEKNPAFSSLLKYIISKNNNIIYFADNAAIAKQLIDAGVNIHLLSLNIIRKHVRDNPDIVILFLESGLNSNTLINNQDENLLHLVCDQNIEQNKQDYLRLMSLLINNGFDPYQKNKFELSPFDYAKSSSFETKKILQTAIDQAKKNKKDYFDFFKNSKNIIIPYLINNPDETKKLRR